MIRASLMLLLALCSGHAVAEPLTDVQAFEKLRSLAGAWQGKAGHGEGRVEFRLASGGTAVEEKLFPNSPHEMLTLYTLDKGVLYGQHYCAMGNQPRFKYVAQEDGSLRFEFAGGGNLNAETDVHVHEGHLQLQADGALHATWSVFKGGQKVGSNDFVLRRLEGQ